MIRAVPDQGADEPSLLAILRPSRDAPGLVWLGQSGFALQSRAGMVVVDPYLSDSLEVKYQGTRFPHRRLHPAPVRPENLGQAKLVLCTHRHTDHMDAATLLPLAAAGSAVFMVPEAWRTRVVGFGIDGARVVGVNDGDDLEPVPGIRVRPVLAAHEALERDDAGHSLHLGYVLTVPRVTFYHAGDCSPFVGQTEGLAGLGIDVALLPVNGRDASRLRNGVPGNFHPAESVALASAIGASVLIGMHFGLFEFNTVNEDDLARGLRRLPADIQWVRPAVGRRVALARCSTVPTGLHAEARSLHSEVDDG